MCVFVVVLERDLVSCPCTSIPASDFEQLISVGQQQTFYNIRHVIIVYIWKSVHTIYWFFISGVLLKRISNLNYIWRCSVYVRVQFELHLREFSLCSSGIITHASLCVGKGKVIVVEVCKHGKPYTCKQHGCLLVNKVRRPGDCGGCGGCTRGTACASGIQLTWPPTVILLLQMAIIHIRHNFLHTYRWECTYTCRSLLQPNTRGGWQ